MMKIGLSAEGKLVGIEKADNGLGCRCVCSGCGKKLVAKNGGSKGREKHFAHYDGTSCDGMTWVHKTAQMILFSSRTIKLPNGQSFNYEEGRLEVPFQGFKTDVFLITESRQILVEVVVANDLNDEKISKIRQLGLECIRLDLADVARDIELDTLESLVLEDLTRRSWIFQVQQPNVVRQQNLQDSRPIGNDVEKKQYNIIGIVAIILLIIAFFKGK